MRRLLALLAQAAGPARAGCRPCSRRLSSSARASRTYYLVSLPSAPRWRRRPRRRHLDLPSSAAGGEQSAGLWSRSGTSESHAGGGECRDWAERSTMRNLGRLAVLLAAVSITRGGSCCSDRAACAGSGSVIAIGNAVYCCFGRDTSVSLSLTWCAAADRYLATGARPKVRRRSRQPRLRRKSRQPRLRRHRRKSLHHRRRRRRRHLRHNGRLGPRRPLLPPLPIELSGSLLGGL